MRAADRRARLRAVLAGETCVHPASVFDPVSARIASDIGFELGMFAGSVASLAVLGAPDLILLTLTEFADQARRIGRAANLPLLVDADHGYGNALNVVRTVEELEAAGVAGLTIEDTALPQAFGLSRPTLVSTHEAIGKMRAAVAARDEPGLCVFARTGAVGIEGLRSGVERLKAYQDCGVDGVFFTGVATRAEVETLAQAARLPLLLGGSPAELMDRSFLAEHGVRIALQGHQPFAAATHAIARTLRALRDGAPLPDLADADAMKRAANEAAWKERADRFLR